MHQLYYENTFLLNSAFSISAVNIYIVHIRTPNVR